jgi:hypothetical protein
MSGCYIDVASGAAFWVAVPPRMPPSQRGRCQRDEGVEDGGNAAVAELSSKLTGSMRAGSWAVSSNGRSRRGLREAMGAALEQGHSGKAWGH